MSPNTSECDRCGTETDEPVEQPETLDAVCQSCHTHWGGDGQHYSPVVKWEKHIAEENYDRKNPDRHCLLATTEVGEAMTGIYQKKVTFLGIDSKGRILVHRGDQNSVDLLVPQYLRGFEADYEQVKERYKNRHSDPHPYQEPSPRHGFVGFRPLIMTPGHTDHLYRLERHKYDHNTNAAGVLMEIANDQGLEELSTRGYKALKRSRLERSDKVAEEHKPPLQEDDKQNDKARRGTA